LTVTVLTAFAVGFTGCTTTTRRYAAGETRRTVSSFAEEDINDTVSRAVQSVCSQDRIKLQAGANRAVLIVDIAQKLSLLSQRADDMQRELDALKAPLNEPDGETIAGKHYNYGEVAK
jgi:hypothetical protein